MEREEALVLFENLTGAAPHVAEHVLDAHGWVGAGWLAGDAWVLPPPLRMALLLLSAPRPLLA